MTRLLLPALLGAVLGAGCDRSPSDSGGPIETVLLAPDGRVLARGETLALEPTVRNRGGEAPSDERMAALAWSSSDPGVATVAGGTVTGVAPGTAVIRAELEGVAGTVQVRVADPASACGEPGVLARLAVGGSVTVQGVEAALLCLEAGDYVAVPFNAGAPGAGYAAMRLSAVGAIPPAPALRLPSAPAAAAAGEERWREDAGFHLRLRERAERELAPLVEAAIAAPEAGGAIPGPRFAVSLRDPRVGQEVQVNTSTASCDSTRMRSARVVAVGERSAVLADLANPSGGLSAAEYASFAAGFDTLVWPTITAAFGEPRDVDGNGKVLIFYTRAVNELTPPGSAAYIGGYFHARDLFPTRARDGLSACAGSNVAELFYMLVPDPSGTVNGNPFPRSLVLEKSLGTIAHEFQHLVNASRRLYVVGTTHWNEEVWLNEAMSHAAEEVVFHRVSGLSPGRNLAASDVSSGAAAAAFRSHQEENMKRLQRFLSDVETQSPYDAAAGDADDLATRGAGWSFLRYAADRRGGSDADLWKALVDGSTTGLANLQLALGRDPRPWVRDWLVSLYAGDHVPGADPAHVQPSWLLRSFWNPYPLHVRTLPAGGAINLSAKAGSGAFVRFGVAPGTTVRVSATTTAGLPLSSAGSLTIVRTR